MWKSRVRPSPVWSRPPCWRWLRSEELFHLDYAEVVDAVTLEVPPVLSGEARLLIAGRMGKARLIDNVPANAVEG